MPSIQGAVPRTCNCSTKPQMEELCYVFISRFLFNVRLLLLLQLKQTPTDSSYKPSFKKKDQPGTEKHQYKYYGYSVKFRGDRCSYDSKFFPQRYTMGFPTTLQCHIFILVFIFHFYKYSYITFFCILLKKTTQCNVVVF